jgi:nitrite reductase (NADH) small subunit
MSKIKKWVRVTEVENIPLREGRAVQIGGHDIAVFNLGDRFLAVGNKCPHRGGPLADGIVSGSTVACPLHAWKIDLNSGEIVNQPENSQCVRTFPTLIEKGVLSIEIEVNVNASLRSETPVNCLASISRDHHLGNSASSEV